VAYEHAPSPDRSALHVGPHFEDYNTNMRRSAFAITIICVLGAGVHGHSQTVENSTRRVEMLIFESDSTDAAQWVSAVTSQLVDLPVSCIPISIESVQKTEIAIDEAVASRFASGAAVVIWFDDSAPGVVWFATVSPGGPMRYRRQFQSDDSPSQQYENLAQIARATVQVLLDQVPVATSAQVSPTTPTGTKPASYNAGKTQLKTEAKTAPVVSRQEADGHGTSTISAAPPKVNSHGVDVEIAYVYRAFSTDNLLLNGLYAGLATRPGNIWRVRVGADVLLQKSTDEAMGCFRAQVRQVPVIIGAAALWPIGESRFSFGVSTAFVTSVDKITTDWTGTCQSGESIRYPKTNETTITFHQEIGVELRVAPHRRFSLMLRAAADVLLKRAVYIERPEIDTSTGYSLRMERLPVAPTVTLGIGFGVMR